MKINLKLLILILFAAFFLTRMVYLTADSPTWLSWSTAPFTDEGSKAMHIRNFLLFGEQDITKIEKLCNDCIYQTSNIVNNFVVNIPLIIVFSLWGINFFAMRFLSVIFGMLSLLLVFLIVRQFFDQKTAILATALLGLNFVFIMYNKLGLLETPMTFFIILSVFFWSKSLKKNTIIFSILSTISFAVALLYKPIALSFIPGFMAMIIIPFLKKKNYKSLITKLAMFAIAMIFVIIVWGSFVTDLGVIAQHQGIKTISEIARTASIFFINRMFIQMPIMLLISLVFSAYIVVKFLQTGKFNELELVAVFWLYGMWAFFSLRTYQAARYLIAMIPAMSILSGIFLIKLFQLRNSKQIICPKNKLSKLVSVVFYAIFVFGISLYLNKFFISNNSVQEITIGTIFTFPLIALIVIAGYAAFKKIISARLTHWFYKKLAIILLFFILLNSFIPFIFWISTPQYSLQQTMRTIEKLENPKIIGLWTESLCFESEFRCYAGADGTNFESVFQELQITHILIGREEIRDFTTIQIYDNYESIDIKKIDTFVVGSRPVDLYQVIYKS